MGTIVAIGGGEIGRPGHPIETKAIDKEILRLSGKKNPEVLFIGTASSDAQGYIDVFTKHYSKLGAKVSSLKLTGSPLSKVHIKKKIMSADVIYVGGGNTLKMIGIWKKLGVDKMLMTAYRKGIILSGLSAGSICWFKRGLSDSRRFRNPEAPLIKVSALGIINATHCPHYDNNTGRNKGRKKDFEEIMKNTPGVGIGIDECCALVVEGNMCRTINSKKGAAAYKVFWSRGKVHHGKIADGLSVPLEILTSK